jgi:hypothetical protein
MQPDEWERLKALSAYSSVYPQYRILDGNLLVYPVVRNTHTLAVEYKTEYLVIDSDGNPKKYFTADNDICQLNFTMLLLGLRYFWKAEKGMNFAKEQALYIASIRSLGSQSGQRAQINMAAEAVEVKPGVYIPDSNWPVG